MGRESLPCTAQAAMRATPACLLPQIRTAYVTFDSKGKAEVTAGLKDLKASLAAPGQPARLPACLQACSGACCPPWAASMRPPGAPAPTPAAPQHAPSAQVLKTTQSGYSGFLHDKYTTLPDASDRIVATSVTATWR